MTSTLRAKRVLLIGIAVIVIVGAILAWALLSDSDHPVSAGQSIVVTVTAASLEDMYGYQFNLNFDHDQLELTRTVARVPDMMIFSRTLSDHELVGSTMVGERDGISGRNIAVSEIIFVALQDLNLSEFDVSITSVNIVRSDMEYIEDIEGWTLSKSVQP